MDTNDAHRTPLVPAGPGRTLGDMATDEDALEPEEFEEMVAALLKVDPEGITGQRSEKAKKAKEQSE